MGASNYSYTSPLMEQKMSDEYSGLVYVDEWGCGPDESAEGCEYFDESISSDIQQLLSSHLKGFDAEPDKWAVDDYLPYWYELRHTSIMGRYDHDQGASILGTVGRMVVMAVPGYYGNDIAIVVTPNYLWQSRLFTLEGKHDTLSINWGECSPQERACWATAIRTLRTDALARELAKTFQSVLRILDEHGGYADRMRFRTSAWTSVRYQPTADAA